MLPLPPDATALLDALDTPPRLRAHLRAVHDVAASIVDWVTAAYPGLPVDRAAVLFGAATHDIGKTIHVEELSAPGTRHEAAGHRLLLDRGVPERLARFAGTHGSWTADGIELEDLLVSLADKVWKVKDQLTALAETADERLAFQNSHPIRG